MAQTFTTPNSGTGAEVDDDLLDNTNTLRSSFSGSSAAGSPVQGQLWLDTSAAEYALKVYGDLEGTGAAQYEIGSVLHTDLKLRNNQLVDVRLENKTAETTPGAGVIGEVYLHTTAAKMRVIVSATVREVVMSGSNVDYIPLTLPARAWDLDATNPPTAVTVGTTPTIRGLLFDATNEKMSIAVPVPAGYSADADLKLRVWCYLNAAETASDTIDAAIQVLSLQPDNGELATATSTQYTKSESIGAQNTQYALHKFDFTITYNDATNPVAAGDMLEIEFALSSIASVAGIIFRSAQLLVPFGTKITE